ncbi:hypothetical protein SAMN04244574_04664 [Azotobacter beijerinckii]|uniref:Uncharacterized protein n=1 Tax=Azotobacter beijerinckii TaxID=170623 RepID=A0A1I4IQ80_9GAMM|nr:hypothetical protein SAMN04244574_04664 [Azotobacter beijerinckii]
MRGRARPRHLLAVVMLCLGAGCRADGPPPSGPSGAGGEPEQTLENAADHAQEVRSLKVFADERFYRQRPEPEEVITGVLQAAPVREGPNTRDMPFVLLTGTDRLSVYVSGFDEERLQPYLGHAVEVVGKRVDQRDEGYGIEIWIAAIRLR